MSDVYISLILKILVFQFVISKSNLKSNFELSNVLSTYYRDIRLFVWGQITHSEQQAKNHDFGLSFYLFLAHILIAYPNHKTFSLISDSGYSSHSMKMVINQSCKMFQRISNIISTLFLHFKGLQKFRGAIFLLKISAIVADD